MSHMTYFYMKHQLVNVGDAYRYVHKAAVALYVLRVEDIDRYYICSR